MHEQVNEVEICGKSQDDIVSLLRNVDVGRVVRLTVSRQTSDDLTQQASTTRAFDTTDSGRLEPTSSTPSGESKEKRSNNGASSPGLRCLTTKTDENDNPVVDSSQHVELIELSIAVADDEMEASTGLGVSIKGVSSGHEDHGLFIRKIIEGRAAAKVGVHTFLSRQRFFSLLSCTINLPLSIDLSSRHMGLDLQNVFVLRLS